MTLTSGTTYGGKHLLSSKLAIYNSLFVFWQISLRVRFDNRAIRHGLLADSQMNEFAVNRHDDASAHKSFVRSGAPLSELSSGFVIIAHRTCIALNQIGKYFRKDTVASASERASVGAYRSNVICRANGVPINATR